MPSFPRRRESCLIFKNYCKNNLLIKFGQDSRLRGNDDDLTISYFILGFAKVSVWVHNDCDPADRPDASEKSPRGLTGKKFEDWLAEHLGGTGGFQANIPNSGSGSRDFDVAVVNRWIEAKSGEYWNKSSANFKNKLGEQQKIANYYGKTLEVHSNTPIPNNIKEWLDKRGVPYFEYLD